MVKSCKQNTYLCILVFFSTLDVVCMLRMMSIGWVFLMLCACSSMEEAQKNQIKERNEKKDYIHRSSSVRQYPELKLVSAEQDLYPWDTGYTGQHSRITMDFFRCKGNSMNPPRAKEGDKQTVFLDCGGSGKHSLPIRDGKEVITCGHRCPDHHRYCDASTYSQNSKHMIGAEVDFYVVGFEDRPQEIVDYLMQYYKETEPYKSKKDYETFLRLKEGKINVSTPPWFNKEILIKIYLPHEGRDLDNQQAHAYVSIQVRFDRDKQEKVVYSWDKAWGGYMRY
jgi:hypothetical protein